MLKLPEKNTLKTISFCLSALLISACANTFGGPNHIRSLPDDQFYSEDFPVISPDTLAAKADKDVFRIGDVADISVYNVDNLSNAYPIDRAGNVNFPLIGTQKVAGLTTLDLQNQLISEYGATYLQNPSIIVKREQTVLGKFVVDGSVSSPGVFDLDDPIVLSAAIALAGGLSDIATNEEIYLAREIEGERKVKKVNLKEIRQIGANDPLIYPGDIVYVPDGTSRVAYEEFRRAFPLLTTAILFGTR